MGDKHVTILGGSGFIGSNLAAHLSSQGYQIKILTRYKAQCQHLFVLPRVEIVQGDVHNAKFLERQVGGSDCVVNLIGILNTSGRERLSFEQTHVGLMQNLVAACNQQKVNKLVYLSSLKADADDAPSEYLKTKGRAESELRRNGGKSLKWSILQPSIVFGTNDSFINRFAKLLKLPMPIFFQPRGNARVAPVFVNDVVAAIQCCMERSDTHGMTFQLCGPHVFSLKEIMQIIAKELGVRRKIVNLPDGLSRIIAAVGNFVPGKPFTTDNFNSLKVHSICDINGFGRLGINPTSLKTILRTYLGDHVKMRRYAMMREGAGRN